MDDDQVNEFKVRGEELLGRIKDLIHEGNIRKIIIKDDKGHPYMEIPLTIGVVGALIAPILAAVGALAAMASNFNVEIVKNDPDAPNTPEKRA